MEFVCAQETLKAGLATIGRAAGGRTTMPVLANVLIETQDGMLKLSATNLDVAMQAWVVAHVVEPGRASVPVRLLTEFVNSLPGYADIRLGTAPTDPFSLTVDAGSIHATLRGMDPDEFPPLAPWGDAAVWLVPARDFRTMIDQVAFSAATEMSRPVLTGVMVTADEAGMVLSAADGYRLSVRRLNLGVDGSPGTALSLLIPAKTVIELARLLVSDQVRLEISVNKGSSQVLFRVEAPTGGQVTVIGTRLLEGVFPDLERVIPNDSATEVVASRAELMTAIRIANLFAKDAMNVIALDIFPEGEPDDGTAVGTDDGMAGKQSLGSPDPGDMDDAEGALGRGELEGMDVILDVNTIPAAPRRQPVLRISAQAQDIGNHATRIPVKVSGAAMSVSLSSQFLGDVLAALRCDLVILNFTSPTSPVVVRGMGVDGYIHVIMPMHSAR